MRESTRRNRVFYSTLTPRSRYLLDAAVFCLFAPIGITIDIARLGSDSLLFVFVLIVMTGGSAVLFARAGFTGRYVASIGTGLALQGVLMLILQMLHRPAVPASLNAAEIDAVRNRLGLDIALLIAFIAIGYTLILKINVREATRYFATTGEIKLAQRIHQSLVPDLGGTYAGVEWAGTSKASGDIGGDLVDVVQGTGLVVGCVADVSGHGVAAGLLMGMFKTAFRASVARTSDPAELLAEVHVTLAPLTESNMFVTAAAVRVTPGSLQFAGAGHPPMVVYRAATGRVEEIASTGPAIALLDDFNCSSVSTRFMRGDIALLVTDGILESLDDYNREIGLEPLRRVLVAQPMAPLPELVKRITALASTSVRADDQTVLIVRAVA